MTTYIVEGWIDLIPSAKQWAIPGTFPRRYWDVITASDADELAAYLAGHQPFIKEEREEPVGWYAHFGQEARDARRQPPEHACARCGNPCKSQFRYCYRCHNYLKVREKAKRTR